MIARSALLAGIAALAGATVLPADAIRAESAAPAQQINPFNAPAEPVLISRTLVRLLSDGKSIRVTRTYRMQFRREGEGWRIDGEVVDVAVEAPPLLEQFAAIERSRAEPAMFPLYLDAAGRLVPRSTPVSDDARSRAVRQAEAMMVRASQSPAAHGEARAILAQVSAAAGTGTAWPTDLFNPASPASTDLRDLGLPDGSRGTVEVALNVEGHNPGHLPARVERVVTTRLSGTQRVTREIWTMVPQQP